MYNSGAARVLRDGSGCGYSFERRDQRAGAAGELDSEQFRHLPFFVTSHRIASSGSRCQNLPKSGTQAPPHESTVCELWWAGIGLTGLSPRAVSWAHYPHLLRRQTGILDRGVERFHSLFGPSALSQATRTHFP